MRIAYSCAGEGFGHAARMVVLAKELARRHQVSFFVPDAVKPFLESKLDNFEAESLPYFAFEKKADSIKYFRTIFTSFPQILDFPRKVRELAGLLKHRGIEAVISDFDPYLSWAGKAAGIPVLQINHPGLITRKFHLDPHSWLPSLGACLMEGPWTSRIHISFFHGDVGPLYRPSLFRYEPTPGDHIIFSLKDCYKPLVKEVLKDFPGVDARFFPDKTRNFEAEFASCAAVVSSAGHQIIAEALALGKPILLLPQKGQWEQTLNARMLVQTGRGAVTTLRKLKASLPAFLKNLENHQQAFESPLPAHYSVEDGQQALLDKIEQFLKTHRRRLPAVRTVLRRLPV